MNISFQDQYYNSKTWYEKCIVLEIYHFARLTENKEWTIKHTADSFGISIGLASENLKLAKSIRADESIINCKSRQEALDKIKV